MKTLGMILLLASLAGADETAVEILAGLCDDVATRAAVRKRLDAAGFDALATLDRLPKHMRTDEGQAFVRELLLERGREIRNRVLAGDRKWFVNEVLPKLKGLRVDTLWRLRVDREGVLYFNAKTFRDPKARARLEYLVCPDPPRTKSYEALAGMHPDEWKQFGRAFSGGRELTLRWFVWGLASVNVSEALRWAKPRWRDYGVVLGEDHDESRNRKLPPMDQHIQIGVRIR